MLKEKATRKGMAFKQILRKWQSVIDYCLSLVVKKIRWQNYTINSYRQIFSFKMSGLLRYLIFTK